MSAWIIGLSTPAPAAGTQLLKIVPSAGKTGQCFGMRITSQEANAAGKVWRLRKNVGGVLTTIVECDVTNPSFLPGQMDVPLAELTGNGIDYFEVVSIANPTALTLHQAAVLYAER